MKKRYFLAFLQAACFLLISFFLPSCVGTTTIERKEQGRRKRVRIEIDQEEGEEQRLMEQGQEISSFDIFPPEIWQHIFSHLDFEGVLSARAVNRDWNQLITGFREVGIVGVNSKPSHTVDKRSWVKRKEIDFGSNKLKELIPETIPSFAFYRLMGNVKNLPQSFWPYLQRTNIHTLDLRWSKIGAQGAEVLVKHLQETRVHTVVLSGNYIGYKGAEAFAKHLQGTHVHTLNLSYNGIGAKGAIELAKVLPDTQVHTLYLGANQIGAAGVCRLAKALSETQVHTLELYYNEIGTAGASELAKILPGTRMHTLDLGRNQIEDIGARELAKALPATCIHTLYLGGNPIRDATQQSLKQ
ncbi:MAG: F-box-like domain-containing protein [Candidatus Amoebophilus sp.]